MLPRLIPLLCTLSLFHCAADPAEQDCDDVIEHISDQCFYDDSFHESPNCAPEEIDLQLKEACNSVDADLKSDGICIFGFGGGCASVDTSPPLVLDLNCENYLELTGAEACDYYRCKEESQPQEEQCGDSGYYLGYGLKYCQRFQQSTRSHLSAAGDRWLDSVMNCLMRSNEEEVTPDQSCQELKTIAFDSHPGCYVQTGFCELSWNDKAWIFFTVDRADIKFRQIFSTGAACF